MRWSQIKTQVESRFAPSVAGRIALHNAGYRWHHDADGRIWITVDGVEVANFCTLTYWNEKQRLKGKMKRIDEVLDARGVMTRWRAAQDLREYLNLSIEDALRSTSPLQVALAFLDSRLGKRRLAKLDLPEDAPDFVIRLYAFRLQAEGLENVLERRDVS